MISDAVRKGLRMFRQSRTYRDHHVYRHWERVSLDRHTAAMLLTCCGATWLARYNISDLMFEWEVQKNRWRLEVEVAIRNRPFTIGDFVTYILCKQERLDGEELRNAWQSGIAVSVDISDMQANQDEVMQDAERDLQLAGFLQYTNAQVAQQERQKHKQKPQDKPQNKPSVSPI